MGSEDNGMKRSSEGFVDIDTFMKNLERTCKHKWVVISAIPVGYGANKKMVFSTLAQCKLCKEIMVGE